MTLRLPALKTVVLVRSKLQLTKCPRELSPFLDVTSFVLSSCRTSASLGLQTCEFFQRSSTPRLLNQAAIKASQLQTDLWNTMATGAAAAGGGAQKVGKFKYPAVRRDESTTYTSYGVKVVDAYRWLEDADSEETKKFVEAQNALTDPYIKSCPHRGAIITRLRDLFEYPRYGCPFKEGPNYYINVNSGLQNQAVLYIMRGSLDAKQEVFLDPNTLSKDGTVSLSTYTNEFSKDGKWFAYGLNTSGSDWITLRIKNVDTGKDLPEELNRLKFSGIAWTHDNKGFFYSAFPNLAGDGTETTECTYQKLYYHRIGTPQSEDVLVYERPDEPNFRFTASVSDCGYYLHVWTNQSCEYNLWHYHRFEDPLEPSITGLLSLETVVDTFNADYHYVANDGPKTVFRTNFQASNYRLCVVDLSDRAAARLPASWTDLIPEHPKDVLEGAVAAAGDLLVASYIRDVTSRIQLHRLADGSLLRELPLPLGNVTGLAAKREQKELFYSFTSFLIPGIVYHLVLEGEGVSSKAPTVFREAKPSNFDHSKFVTEQVFYESKDGTKVPMFLVHKKDFVKDGQSPCRLYAYGGFNISIKPSFSLQNIILMENLGGLFALANIRGGGEYGEKWHNAGKLEKKQSCFDDFIAAAEYLTKEKYTNSKKLFIEGGSNGGLLISAVSNQRPELFGAGIAHVGVMDLLRFHKFTIGSAWRSEYGNPEKEADFRNLIRLSPLHNVPEAASVDHFPATLLLTADHDDRVVPLHSFKLIAELQHKLGEKFADNTPLLARIDTKSGHGFGKPTEKIIEEIADIYSFIINALKLEYKQ